MLDIDEGLSTGRVQRLNRKPRTDREALASRAFGGAAMLMTEGAWKAVQNVVDLHYMGAAEYEFGALPMCLNAMVQGRDQYELWFFVIKADEVKPGSWRKAAVQDLRKAELAKAKEEGTKAPRMTKKHRASLEKEAGVTPAKNKVVYVLSFQARDSVETMIRAVGNGEMKTKNGAGFDLDPDPKWTNSTSTIGWLDLDNQLAWFIDLEVRDSFAAMLGIRPENRQ